MSTPENKPANPILTRDKVVYALDREAEPRLTIDPGTVVTFETHDARGGRMTRPDQVEETTPDFSERFPRANPATGPVFVRGAVPGSRITVEILNIDLDERGFILVKPDMGVIRGFSPKPIARMCEVHDGKVHFAGLRLPARPMVGVIGVAPAGDAIATAFVGEHGGNMDTTLAKVGSSISLRTQAPGGLVYIGDAHATMGDGEVSGTGVEIGARVTVRIGLDDVETSRWPRLYTPDLHAVIASAPTFEEATAIVVSEAIEDVVREHALSPADAFMMISAVGDLRVNQACRSKIDVSLRLELPRL